MENIDRTAQFWIQLKNDKMLKSLNCASTNTYNSSQQSRKRLLPCSPDRCLFHCWILVNEMDGIGIAIIQMNHDLI